MSQFDNNTLFGGFVVGLLVGAGVAVFRGPRIRPQELRGSIEKAIPNDPIDESIAEGKAAARKRRAELGLE